MHFHTPLERPIQNSRPEVSIDSERPTAPSFITGCLQLEIRYESNRHSSLLLSEFRPVRPDRPKSRERATSDLTRPRLASVWPPSLPLYHTSIATQCWLGCGRDHARTPAMSSTGPIEAAEPDQIFKDKKFWIAQRCPTRSAFIDVIHFLGGELVPLEKQADHLIVDHLRESNPVGSISYKWIEDSYKKGTPQPLEDYLQGSPNRDSRASGSAKSSRTPFTPEDDRMLWNWVQDHEKIGGKALGNEIYKSLGQKVSYQPPLLVYIS